MTSLVFNFHILHHDSLPQQVLNMSPPNKQPVVCLILPNSLPKNKFISVEIYFYLNLDTSQ